MNIITKGKTGTFTIYFPETTDDDPPDFTVKTPAGLTFISGQGLWDEEKGTSWFKMQTVIPVKAPSSTANAMWSITWSKGTVIKTMYFDVQDPDLSDDELYLKELTKLAIATRPYTARIIVSEQVSNPSLTIYSGDTVLSENIIATPEDHRLGTQLSASIDSSLLVTGEFNYLWTTDSDDYYQKVMVAPISMLGLINKIRFMIDKVLKEIDEPQAYADSDIYASILGGIDYVNLVHPLTEWTAVNYPKALFPFLPYAAGIYLLSAQYMLETDLAFSYSGQSVSLDYDRTGAIESTVSKYKEYLDSHLSKAKKNALRTEHIHVGLTMGANGLGQMTRHANVRSIITR